jgi:hypothetical protein
MRIHPGIIAASSSVTPPPTNGAYSFDWAAGVFSGPSGPITDPLAANLLTFSRASGLNVPDSTGKYQSYASGVPAINSAGWWRRGQTRTNYIRNNSMVGAAVGTPGKLPGGASPLAWSQTGIPGGITTSVVATGSADPVLGLPYIDLNFSGTATQYGTYFLQMGANSQTQVTASSIMLGSAWMQLVSGTLIYDNNVTLSVQYTTNLGGYVGGTNISPDRLMNRDNVVPRRIKVVAPAIASNTYYGKLSMNVAFRSGQAYNFTVRLIAPQFEAVTNVAEDASFPILTTTAVVTHVADSISASGALLSSLQGGSGTIEMTTNKLSASGIDFRITRPLIGFNGTIQALNRGTDGSVQSQLASGLSTYRAWRSNYNYIQQHALQWNGSNIQVASTGPRDISLMTTATMPAITSVTFDCDGAMKALVCHSDATTSLAPYATITADHIVYGATSGAPLAAAETIKQGSTAVIVGGWRDIQPGGMSTGGLEQVDASNINAFGGMARDWMHWMAEYNGNSSPDAPGAPASISLRYFDYLLQKYQIPMHWSKGVATVTKNSSTKRIQSFTTYGNTVCGPKTVYGKFFTDCSYEGDLMAQSGVTWAQGREAKDTHNPYNGNLGTQPGHTQSAGMSGGQFTPTVGGAPSTILNVDPWTNPGDPTSPLLPGVGPAGTLALGAADGGVQAYCFRMSMTTTPSMRVPLGNTPPPGYSAHTYELLGRYLQAIINSGYTCIPYNQYPIGNNQFSLGLIILLNGTTNFDINANQGFSIDYVGQSAAYPSASYTDRETIWKAQENYQRGLFYYLQYENDSRIPAQIRTDALLFGLRNDYYLDPHENDVAHWMPQLYVREARRMVGLLTLNADDVLAVDGTIPRSTNIIATGSYGIDSHAIRRLPELNNGVWRTIVEGCIYSPPSGDRNFPIAMEYLMPVRNDCTNLLVTFACSAKHTGFGGLRMELAHMSMSQSAGAMAAQLVQAPTQPDVQDINYSTLRATLLAEGQVMQQVN